MQNFREPDEFLVQMKDEQKQNFEALNASLSELKGTLDADGRSALSGVASAAEALKNTNARLIEEFALAKRENDTLRQAVSNATGMTGGSDFIVGRSEEHTSELQSLMRISYAVFCLKKKKHNKR